MTTKTFLKTFPYYQFLNSQSHPSALLRNCQQCLPLLSQPRWQNASNERHHFSMGCSEKTFGFTGRAETNENALTRRLHRCLSSTEQLQKRVFSTSYFDQASKNERQNGEVFSSDGDSESTDVNCASWQSSSVLDKDTLNLSELSQIERKETDVLNVQSVTNEAVTMENNIETEKLSVESLEGNGGIKFSSALVNTKHEDSEVGLPDDPFEVDILAKQDSPIVLEEFIKPSLPSQSLTLASYADHSMTLQKLVELGVDLSKVEKRVNIGNALIKMDFDKHIKDKIIFLHRVGISGKDLGRLLTINPFVLTEELDNLETRIQYLRAKKFSEDAITQVLTRAPYFISFSVDRVDSKLGFYQKELSLTGDELRHVITKTPKLVTSKVQHIKENLFLIRQQLGFTRSEMKNLILADPRVLLRGKQKLISIFDLLHNHMGIPHKQFLKNPQVFNGRVFRLQERHQFLKKLCRAQYDPTLPGYISVEQLSKLPDDVFAQDIAKSSIVEYNNFLKTL